MTKICLYGMIAHMCIFTFVLAHSSSSQAKSVNEIMVQMDTRQDKTLSAVIQSIEKQTDFSFSHLKNEINTEDYGVDLLSSDYSLGNLLREIAGQTDLSFHRVNEYIQVRKRPLGEQTLVEEILQTFPVKGTVTDQNGEGIPGATVLEEGTQNGAVTDFNGEFSLEVDENATLIISYVGYVTQKVKATGTPLTIVLEEDLETLETVVISGIRGSQTRAVNIKRKSPEFVDAITAEDAGKLPDANVAEALQRVAGVTISRTRGQGDFISIRGLGPEFARGSLNGRSIVSASTTRNSVLSGGLTFGTGRATNFDVLPSDIIERIEVFKTSSASHIEGGIGGSVNIKTARPLTLGKKFGFNAKGVSFMERGISPAFSGYGSWANEDNTLGFLLSATYSKRKIREDMVRTFAYRVASESGALADTEFADVLFPFSSLPEVIEEDRERITLNGTFQWKPSENTDIVFDATYSKRNLDYLGKQANIRVNPLNGTDPVLESIVVEKNTATSWTGGAPIFLVTSEQLSQDNIFSAGLNLTQKMGEWTGSLDMSYGATKTDYDTRGGALRVPGSDPNFINPYNTFIEDNMVQVESISDFDFSDPFNYIQRGATGFANTDISDAEFATRLDLERDLTGFFSKFKAGLRYRTRERTNDFIQSDGPHRDTEGNAVVINLGESGAAYSNGVSGFFNGEYSNGFYEDLIFIDDLDEWQRIHNEAGEQGTVTDPNNNYEITENTMAAYAQLDIEEKIADINVTGNVGLRIVNTDITVSGERQNLSLAPLDPNDPDPNGPKQVTFVDPLIAYANEGSYLSVLPSLNLRLEPTSNVFFRLAYSKTITRPQFVNMAGFSYNATNIVANAVGNPDLNPYESDNYDIGLEWYTGGSGVVGITFFYKNLSSFVTSVNYSDFEDLGVVWDSYSTYENQGEGSITGTEITFQQPLTFLPGVLDGLGIIANFTFADGEQSLNDGTPISFPGVSDFSFNSALYFDNGGKFQARLAYTYRDDFLIIPDDVFGQEQYNYKYGQLDASVSYNFLKNITLFGEAINLTNERNQLYTSNISSPAFNLERPTSYEITGVRWAFGIRGSF